MALAFRALFGLALMTVAVFAFGPAPPSGDVENADKIWHAVAFLLLGSLAVLAWPKASPWRAGLGLAGFGAAIEIIQPWVGRSRSLADFWADLAGLALALVLAAAWRRWRVRGGRARP